MSTTKESDLLLKEYKEALRKEVIADVKDSIYALTDVETKVKDKVSVIYEKAVYDILDILEGKYDK